MRPTRLKVDNGAETVPRLIQGHGRLPGRAGEWGLVLLPTAGVGMLVAEWKAPEKGPGVWHIGSDGGRGGDGPRPPRPGTVGVMEAQLTALRALRERGEQAEMGDIALRGEWRAWMHCTSDGPVVELHRKMGGYIEARLESDPTDGSWAWTLARKGRWHGGADERTGTGASLRAAIEAVVQASVALAGASCGVRDTRRRGALDADYTGKAGAVRPSRSRAGRSVAGWAPGVGRTRARKKDSAPPPPSQPEPQLLTVVHHGLKASNLVDWMHDWEMATPERQRSLSVAIDETRRLSTEEWDAFALELMEDRDWLRGKGGTRTLWDGAGDRDWRQLSEAEQGQWRAGAYNVVIAVVAPERPPLYVDPQGYPYARYVYVAQADLPELARLAHLEGVGPDGYYRRALAAWNEWALEVGLVSQGQSVEEWAREFAWDRDMLDEADPRAGVDRALAELGSVAERVGVAEGWAEGQRGQLRRALLGIVAAMEAGWAPAGAPEGSGGKVLSFPEAAAAGGPQVGPPPDSVMVRAEALAGEVEAFFREVEQTFRSAPIHASLAKVHIEMAQGRVMAPELLRTRAPVLSRGDLEVVARDLQVARARFEREADRVLGQLPERADVLERPAFLAIAHWLEGMADQKWVAKPIRDLFLSFVLEGTVGGRPGSTEQLRGAVQSILNASTRRGALDRDHAARWSALWKAFEHLVDHRMPPLPVEVPTASEPAPTPAEVSTDARAILAELDGAQVVAAPSESRIVRQAIEWLEARAGEDDNVSDALVILRGHLDDAVDPEKLADETVAAPDEIVEQVVTHVLHAEEDRRWKPKKTKLSEGWADAFVGPYTPGAWASGLSGSTVLDIGPREYLLAHPGSIAGRLLDYLQRTPPQLWGVAGLLVKARKLLDSPLCRGRERQEAARNLRRAVLAWTQRRPMLPEEQRAHLRALAEGAEALAARCSAGQRDLFAVATPAEPAPAAGGVVGTVHRALDAFLRATGYPDQSGLLRGRLDKWLDTGVGWNFTRRLMATIRREALEREPSARAEIQATYEGLVEAMQADRKAEPVPTASVSPFTSGALTPAAIASLRQDGGHVDGFVGSMAVRVEAHREREVRLVAEVRAEDGVYSHEVVDVRPEAWALRAVREAPLTAPSFPAPVEGRRTTRRMVAWGRAMLADLGVAQASVRWKSGSGELSIGVDDDALPAGWSAEALGFELDHRGPRNLSPWVVGSDQKHRWRDSEAPTAPTAKSKKTAKPNAPKKATKPKAPKTAQPTPKPAPAGLTDAEKAARLEDAMVGALQKSMQTMLFGSP